MSVGPSLAPTTGIGGQGRFAVDVVLVQQRPADGPAVDLPSDQVGGGHPRHGELPAERAVHPAQVGRAGMVRASSTTP